MSEIVRVLVVDDSAVMRGSLNRRIELDPRFSVIDTAVNGAEGVEKALRLNPDVVTLDVEMPVLDGIEALKRIVAQSSIPVVMVSSQTEAGAETTLAALDIGAVDFVPKSRGAGNIHEKLLAAVSARRARAGRTSAGRRPAQQAVQPPPASGAALRPRPRVVVIGSSTGGPTALQEVLAGIPKGFPVPIVIGQHMPATFTRALAKRLDQICALRVVEAGNGESLQRGTVYIAPGGRQMRVTAVGVRISDDDGTDAYRPSIDVLAESARATYGNRVIGVMLTGMGHDGTREFVNLRKAGGYNIAQDRATSVVYGMPRALQQAGGADEVLPLERIAPRLCELLGA